MRGRSHSTRPVSKRPPSWIVYQPDEVKALVINLYRQGRPPSEIGGILRDEYNVP
ncbi:MAG: 30S ribosomal protein S15, partial [Candidatus Bathyarchaeia archaeon]